MKQEKTYFDIQHIKHFKEGDDAAFEIIYEYYKQHIYYMGMQLFHHDKERSKDLVQNTFSEIYVNIKKLKAPEAFYVWMNQIAYRQGCNMLRYQSKDTTYYVGTNEEEFIDHVPDHSQVDLLSDIQQKEAIDIIIEGLNEMDEDKRLVGFLRYFEELSIKEIAEITGIRENTVMSHLHRAKSRLRLKLEDKGFTSATCLSLLIVPNLISYYKAFVELDGPMEDDNKKQIYESVTLLEAKKKSMYWNYVTKVIASMVVVIPVLTVVGVSFQKGMNNEMQLPSFTIVEYDTSLSNQPIALEVKTSNNNYDQILLNDSSKLVFSSNGTYTLSLIKNSNVIDSRKIVVTNIDRNAPEVVEQDIQDGRITFTLEDDLSGLDYDHTLYYVNEQPTDYQIDSSLGKITIPYDDTTNGYLEISDRVGNILKVNINSYTITMN